MTKADEKLRNSISAAERREQERKELNSTVKARFTVEYEGEVVNISPEGLALRFHPLRTNSLDVKSTMRVHLNMNDRIVSLQGTVQNIDEKYGHVTLGLKYDRDEIVTFQINDPVESDKDQSEV